MSRMEMAPLTNLQRVPGGSSARTRQSGRANHLRRKEARRVFYPDSI